MLAGTKKQWHHGRQLLGRPTSTSTAAVIPSQALSMMMLNSHQFYVTANFTNSLCSGSNTAGCSAVDDYLLRLVLSNCSGTPILQGSWKYVTLLILTFILVLPRPNRRLVWPPCNSSLFTGDAGTNTNRTITGIASTSATLVPLLLRLILEVHRPR
jgi:hypothetical protein